MENTSPKNVSKDTYGIKVGKGADKKSYATKSDINETTEGSKSSWTEKFNNSVKTFQEKFGNTKTTAREKVQIRKKAQDELTTTLKEILVDPSEKNIKEIITSVIKGNKKIRIDKDLTKKGMESMERVLNAHPKDYSYKSVSRFKTAIKADKYGEKSMNYFKLPRFKWYMPNSGVRKGSTGFKFNLREINLNLPQLKPNLLYNKYKPKSFDKESLSKSILPTTKPIKYGKDYNLDLKTSLQSQNTNNTFSNTGKLPVVDLDPFKNSKRFDPYPATQAAKLALTEYGNNAATGHLLNAAAKIPQVSRMSDIHLRTAAPHAMLASGQANKMRSAGRRLLNASSNFSPEIMLQAEEKANNIVFSNGVNTFVFFIFESM